MSSPFTTERPRRRSSPPWQRAAPTTRSSARRAPNIPARRGCRGTSIRSMARRTSSTDSPCGRRRSASPMPTERSPAPCSSPSPASCSPRPAAQGATRNGDTIRSSSEVDASLALVATGFGYLASRRAEQVRRLATLIEHIRDIRRGGSAALDLCYAAAGMVDAYFEDGLNSWDVVAGELIASEAGCRTGDFAGGPATPAELLVAPPALFEQLSALLRQRGLAPGQPGYRRRRVSGRRRRRRHHRTHPSPPTRR